MADVPLLPSLVAVIVADPTATPATSPLPFTPAIDDGLLAHVIVRPVSVFPFTSLGVAVSWVVCPTNTDADAGLTVTDATGSGPAVTVTAELPLCPSEVAVIVVEPATTPVTSPLPLTVPTALLLLAQLTVRPLRVLPFASFGVAVSWTVCPACTDADAGLTVTDATGTVTAVTVRVAVPLCPSDVAAIVVEPVAAAVATPLVFTFATAVLLLAHTMIRPPSAVPVESSGTATNCTVPPTGALAAAGSTTTEATGTAVAVTTAVAESDIPVAGSLARTLY